MSNVGTRAMTTSGAVEGRERSGALLFAGVPYAAPPVGVGRFAAPAPMPPWPGVRPAQRFGPAAPQPGGDAESLMGGGPKSLDEDCLTLNICTPACDDGARPVMVWIHGGAFRTGTGAIPWYDGNSFAVNHDVVTVSINYRLGALGFLHLEGFPGSGLNGVKDQVAALEWVRDNIAAFGGDPTKVTVAGESAGAMSVGTLLGYPAAAGLFRAAIPQSGAAHHVFTTDQAAKVTDIFLSELAADPHEASWQQIIEAQVRTEAAVAADPAFGELGMAFMPVVDGVELGVPPLEAIAGGSSADISLLIGTNLDECTLWGAGQDDEDRLIRKLDAMLGDGAKAAEVYRRRLGPDAAPSDVLIASRTDQIFRAPANRLAEAHRGETWSYLFAWASRLPGVGATHALEIPFTFNTLDRAGVSMFLGEGDMPTTLAARMHLAWADFIRHGNPGWERYDSEGSRATMRFADESGVEHDPLADERRLWADRC